ncbi:MAG: type II methionyl aminopeptidase [Candidatus Pacearchaeota archaeon]|nr:type II methionyl aminopeptidase [Candidatus Pacearchaeota archaeon]
MTEKHYGGASGFGFKRKNLGAKKGNNLKDAKINEMEGGVDGIEGVNNNKMNKEAIDKIVRAGKIAQEVKKYARDLIKPGMKLIDIAYKIDDKIVELGGKPGFPVNLSINEVAAHFTPNFDCDKIAYGLLKVDIGVHVDGYIADTAFSLDLEEGKESELNKKLIEAAEAGVKASVETFGVGVEFWKVGKSVQDAIESKGFVSIRNLSGHSIDRWVVHAGWTVPNYNSGQTEKFEPGLYATEPFATNGLGKVKDGGNSGIYRLDREGNVRDNFAREVLGFIADEYQTLPFCARWIHKKFGTRGLLALRMMEQAGILYQYPQLIEVGKGKVAQAEHDVLLLEDGKKIVTTRD